jgi:hypothetical protein
MAIQRVMLPFLRALRPALRPQTIFTTNALMRYRSFQTHRRAWSTGTSKADNPKETPAQGSVPEIAIEHKVSEAAGAQAATETKPPPTETVAEVAFRLIGLEVEEGAGDNHKTNRVFKD